MLPRPQACHGAVQRNLALHLDSPWISDDILRHEWQRFVLGSKVLRRYGSFVPGPLEARRRMGKRRMAHLSADFTPPLPGISSLWGSFWEVDRSQWRWEAPRNRDSEPKSPAPTLPWEQDKVSVSVPKSKVAAKPFSQKDILAFRSKIKSCGPDELPALCADFNQLFKHSLAHGMVSEMEIINALTGISKDLRQAFPSAAEVQCRLFCEATWEGLVACKMLRKDYLGDSTIKVYMDVLSKLSMTPKLQELALNIIVTLSPNQSEKRAVAISSMVDGMVCSWLQATARFLNSKTDSKEAPPSFPEGLAKVLRCLHEKPLSIVLRSSSACVSKFHVETTGIPLDLRYEWLSLVSQLPNACNWRKRFFLRTWKTMEASGVPLQEGLMGPIILQYLVSQGMLIPRHLRLLARNYQKRISRKKSGLSNLFLLLERHTEQQQRTDPEKHRGSIEQLRGQMVTMLIETGHYETLYDILSHMKPLPMTLLGRVLEATSTSDPAFALRLYRDFIHLRGEQEQRFIPELCPNFILSLVNNPDVTWPDIWPILGYPFSQDIPTLPKLRNERVDLITRLAVAFARSKTRPPRVILRNVSRCLLYLRKHNATLGPDVSRAVTQAAVNLKMELDSTVPQERAAWAVRTIQSVEGPEVAETVRLIVSIWNERIYEKRRRAENVLRVGPID